MEYHEMNPEGGHKEPVPAPLVGLLMSPWAVGLMALGAAAFILGIRLAGWYGRPGTTILLFPFIMLMGGLVTFLAGMWAFRAREPIAAVVLSLWGGFFLAYGLLNWLVAAGTLPLISFAELGIVFFVLAAITATTTWAMAPHNAALAATLGLFTLAALFLGIGMQTARLGWLSFGGFVLLLGSLAAFDTASALLVDESFGRVILPQGLRGLGLPHVERPQIEGGQEPGGAAPVQA